MITLKQMHAAAKRYAGDNESEHDAFCAGVQYALFGKWNEQKELFEENKPNVPSFDDWWNAYDKKRGRKKAEMKWNKLSDSDKKACFEATPAYVKSTPDKQYRLDPQTYLNGERWNDEIINKANGTEQRTFDRLSKAARIMGTADSPTQ